MGNTIPNRSSDGTGKVILSDGTVHRYDKPLTAAELMLEYPQQVVYELQPVMNGKKTPPLPADKNLEKGKVYIMLPMKRGKPVGALSSEDARRLLSNANGFLKSGSVFSSTWGLLPLVARLFQAVGGVDEGKPGVVSGRKRDLMELETEEAKPDYFAEILEGRPDFLSKQLSGKGWKPSLDTIKEKSIKMKVRHWLA